MKEISFDGKSFIFNGKREFINSGELHYFRIPLSQWRDRLLKCKMAFLNSIGVYMAWNWHEEEEGIYSFEGPKDINKWMNLIQELGLYIIARPGPYICSEWDSGGFPNWLIPEDCDMRSLDTNYIKYCSRWLTTVNRIIRPYLITNGGKVFIYQIENEFECGDLPYHLRLKKLVKRDGIDVPIVTNENAHLRGSSIIEMPDPYLRSWDISGIMTRIDELRKEQPDKPPFGMEVGCLMYSRFGSPLPFAEGYSPPERDEVYLKSLIAAGMSGFNFYMYHGGTNPGYWTARNVTTTYDFDAPIREWGELNHRYYITRRLGGFLASFGERLLETVPVEGYTSTNRNDVKVFTRKGKGMAFVFLANLFWDDKEFTVSLNHPAKGERLTIPHKGKYRLPGYSMGLIPVNIKLASRITLLYSTSQVFHLIDNDDERILILYEKSGLKGETVFELDKKIKIVGRYRYEWIGKNRLCLNYVHNPSTDYITIMGKTNLKIIITNTEMAERTWLFTYNGKTFPIVSNIYFMEESKEEGDGINLRMQVKEGYHTAEIMFPSKPSRVNVNGIESDFTYDNKRSIVTLKLPEEEFPRIDYDLTGKWKMKKDDNEIEPDYNDADWKDWELCTPLENYGFLKNGYCWYRTTFSISGVRRPLYLTLTGFQDEASVYLNGRFVVSGKDRLRHDISTFVKDGENALVVLLESTGHNCMGQKSFNGITHPVYLDTEEISIDLVEWKRKGDQRLYTGRELLNELQPETVPSFDDNQWEKIMVGKNWDSRLSKNFWERRFCWYRTWVKIPDNFSNKNLSLDFDETVEDIYVYVNGKFEGRKINTGLNLPFSIDITDIVKFGKDNCIAIVVKADRWNGLFGLYRTIKISAHDECLKSGWKIKENLQGQREGWEKEIYDDSRWNDVDVPYGDEDRNGRIAWFRRKVRLQFMEGYVAPLRITLKDTTSKALLYFNGVLIGRYSESGPQEDFYIPEDLLKEENQLAIAIDGRSTGVRLGSVSISPYYVARQVNIKLTLS